MSDISEDDLDQILATDHIYRTVRDLLDNGEYEDG